MTYWPNDELPTYHLANAVPTVKHGGGSIMHSGSPTRQRFIFQPDNDSKHAVMIKMEWLQDHSGSPDLNPIKHLWRDLPVMLPMQRDGARANLQRKMGETAQKQVCQAYSLILKKT